MSGSGGWIRVHHMFEGGHKRAVQGVQCSRVPDILQLQPRHVGGWRQAVRQIQIVGGQYPTILQLGRELDETVRRAGAGREPDVGDQGDAALFRLRQQSQPQHRALDEVIAAEIVAVDETGGGQ